MRLQINLWLLEHILGVVERLAVPLQLLVESTVPVEVRLRVGVNQVVRSDADAHLVPDIKIFE